MTYTTSLTPYQALQRAHHLLEAASLLAAETVDADAKLCHALSQAVGLLADTSRALIEASLTKLESGLH